MKRIDKDGLLLSDLQGQTFELSFSKSETSSEVFIRRFMNSCVARDMDNSAVLETAVQAKDVLDQVNTEYGPSDYGSVKYAQNELYWIGYLYRYFAYTYGKTSTQVYKIIKPKELRGLFLSYHSLDPAVAIERILEAKGLSLDEAGERKRQYEIFKRIRTAQTVK